ncbi:MAG: CvpA family protein [Sphingomonadales bacterium]
MESLNLTSFDILVLTVVVLSGLYGIARGFTSEALSLGAWVGAGFATVYGLPYFRPLMREYVSPDGFADVLAVVVLALVSLIVFKLIAHPIGRFVRNSPVGALDRGLGALFGVVRGMFIVTLVYLLATWIIPRDDMPDWITEARTRPMVEYSASLLASVTPAEIAADISGRLDEAHDYGVNTDLLEAMRPPHNAPDTGTGYSQRERRALEGLIDSR